MSGLVIVFSGIALMFAIAFLHPDTATQIVGLIAGIFICVVGLFVTWDELK